MSAAITMEETRPDKDDLYFFDLVTFKVDNCLFRVPKHTFQEHSHVFRDMFMLPANSDDGEPEGVTDDKPIFLDGVREDAFRLLLASLYPLSFKTSPSLTRAECISLLDLSQMWGFEQIRNEMINEIWNIWYTIPVIEKVELAHKYEVTDWRRSAYTALAMRKEPLSIDEVNRFGVEFVLKMAQVREKRLKLFPQMMLRRHVMNPLFAENAVKYVFDL